VVKVKVFKPKGHFGTGMTSQTPESPGTTEKWLIILLLIIVVIVIVSSIVLYGPHWIKGISAFI
jgi:hypothetical protein